MGELKNKFMVIFCVLFLIGALAMTYHLWTLGDAEEDYSIVCLGGHEYWRANFATKGFLGIKLDRDGKSVECRE